MQAASAEAPMNLGAAARKKRLRMNTRLDVKTRPNLKMQWIWMRVQPQGRKTGAPQLRVLWRLMMSAEPLFFVVQVCLD